VIQTRIMPPWLEQLAPIAILLVVVGTVLSRLPKVDVGHDKAFLRRRFMNWFPLGMTYAFLYMARYNLTQASTALVDLIDNHDFGTIKAVGTIVYGISFVVNGPLTDRIGGRRTMLLAASGSAIANVAMGALLATGHTQNIVLWFSVLYGVNMYFQSFGAVSIVKVNASWFHLRERGTFGGIFGILISLGLYFAYDWCGWLAHNVATEWVFFIPSAILTAFLVANVIWVRDTPGEAGQKDFDTGDADWGTNEARPVGFVETMRSVGRIGRMMLSQPAILVIAAIEFCTGFTRSSLMDWYVRFSAQTHTDGNYIAAHWGMAQCVAGITGGVLAGLISDRVFGSRRGPVAGLLYGTLLVGGLVMTLVITQTWALAAVVCVMMLAVIGVHGMLSGAASMDFGGRKNVGIVVGIIDGLVYLGQGTQYLTVSRIVPEGDAAAVPANWWTWPVAMIPAAAIGLMLSSRIWNARPKSSAAPAH
jgi:OPA family glycerol-3-phosphate transporter-like MFS transporter